MSLFEVGKNVATTEGAVVYENEFQLIEYKPLTAKVHERPFLMVPPCINKFYILDLQPDNSLIRYAVSEGHRTFVVSWRNPDAAMGDRPGTTTSKTPSCAIAVVQEIAGAQDQCAGFLRGRHHAGHRPGGAGRARRAPGGQRHLPDHADRLPGYRHPGSIHR
jgi:poly(3-hydroxyalkanoate) synthetase